ncbi:MAG: hypothetical protein RIS80_1080 [Actinomycetota bacterium]
MPFAVLQFASITSIVSGSMMFLVLPWLCIQITGQASAAGLMLTLSNVPGLLVSPIIGSIIDKFGRRRVGFISELLMALLSLVFPLVAHSLGTSFWLIVLVSVVRALVGAGNSTARKALVPDTAAVANMSLERANSIHEAVFSAGFAVGPAVGALAIGATGAYSAFWWAGGAGLAAALFAFAVRVVEKQEPASADDDKSKPLRYALEGIRALGRYPAVAIIFAALLSISLIYIPTEMVVLPRYYNSIGMPEGLGTLISCMAGAGVVGSLAFEWIHRRMSYANILRTTMFGITAGIVPMSFLPPQPFMLAFGLILGFTWGPVIPLLNTVVQTMVPANLRGRVFSLEMAIWNASPMISFIIIGIAVDSLGVQPVYWVLAAGVLLASILVSLAPQMRALSESRHD